MFTKACIALFAAGALAMTGANNGTHTVTEVVDVYTTYCPEPTHITMNNRTYTVTEACTFTITDCPCTVTHVSTGGAPVNPSQTNSNTGPAPTTVPEQPAGHSQTSNNVAPTSPPAVAGGAGQNPVAYGMAVVGALAVAVAAL